MSVVVKYKGNTIASASAEVTKTLKTSGKYCEADILIENTPDGGDAPVINPLSVTANGTYTAPSGVDGYSPVTVNVPQGITPTGNIDITDLNPTDVTNYATATVVDADLVAENIKKDVNILGVVGSFEGGGGGELPNNVFIAEVIPTADTTSILIANTISLDSFVNIAITSNIGFVTGERVYVHSGQLISRTHNEKDFGAQSAMGHFVLTTGAADYWTGSFSCSITPDFITIARVGNSNGYFKAGGHYQVIIQGAYDV